MEKNVENPKTLNKLRSHFYPKDFGGEEVAYNACKQEAGNEEVYWDDKLESFYYYPKYMVGK